jgi:hypothetical protein
MCRPKQRQPGPLNFAAIPFGACKKACYPHRQKCLSKGEASKSQNELGKINIATPYAASLSLRACELQIVATINALDCSSPLRIRLRLAGFPVQLPPLLLFTYSPICSPLTLMGPHRTSTQLGDVAPQPIAFTTSAGLDGPHGGWKKDTLSGLMKRVSRLAQLAHPCAALPAAPARTVARRHHRRLAEW